MCTALCKKRELFIVSSFSEFPSTIKALEVFSKGDSYNLPKVYPIKMLNFLPVVLPKYLKLKLKAKNVANISRNRWHLILTKSTSKLPVGAVNNTQASTKHYVSLVWFKRKKLNLSCSPNIYNWKCNSFVWCTQSYNEKNIHLLFSEKNVKNKILREEQ